MTNKKRVTVTVDVELKDEDALRLAAALKIQPEGASEPTIVMHDGTIDEQLQHFVGMEVFRTLAARQDIFGDVTIASDLP